MQLLLLHIVVMLMLLTNSGTSLHAADARRPAEAWNHPARKVLGMRRRMLQADGDEGVRISVVYNDQVPVRDGQMLRVSDTAPRPPTLYIDDGSSRSSYSVAMIDRRASRQPGSEQLTFVHYWVVVTAHGSDMAASVDRVLAPYVPPAPHDSLLHPYQFLLFPASPSTTSPPASFFSDRYVHDFEAQLVQHHSPIASTHFTEQIST